jgi:hypothetical protein
MEEPEVSNKQDFSVRNLFAFIKDGENTVGIQRFLQELDGKNVVPFKHVLSSERFSASEETTE